LQISGRLRISLALTNGRKKRRGAQLVQVDHAKGSDGPAYAASIACPDIPRTTEFAGQLAEALKPGDVLLLNGDLAAGKTSFVAMMCRRLGVAEAATSPTYVISNLYNARAFDIFHIDAYRLGGVEDFHHLGLEEYFAEVVTFIEWGERVAEAFDHPLILSITVPEGATEARVFHLMSDDSRWQPVLEHLASAFAGGAEAP
jgi:tRNA threonylcarbamoyladenosine biosynthesis protein TsaE